MNLESLIEAVLFWKAEAISIKKLAEIFNQPETAIQTSLEQLTSQLQGRGVVLVRKDDEVMLGTAPEASSLIEKLAKEELSRDLGKAGLETLTIILYQGPITRAQIDFIRGVNSSFIVRHLQIRGLVEKIPNPKDQRSFLYRPTFDLLQHLGISKVEELPEYGELATKVEALLITNEPKSE